MNMLPAQLSADACSAELDGLRLELNGAREHAGRKVTLGIRPEHVMRGQGHADALAFAVEFVEALGADTLAHGCIGASRLPLMVRLPGSEHVAAGDMLPLLLPAESLHLFDAGTGARL
jgi:sn-glycerol 3-phosphate transport system ATP-binding protein